jgi:hypothetical protein
MMVVTIKHWFYLFKYNSRKHTNKTPESETRSALKKTVFFGVVVDFADVSE